MTVSFGDRVRRRVESEIRLDVPATPEALDEVAERYRAILVDELRHDEPEPYVNALVPLFDETTRAVHFVMRPHGMDPTVIDRLVDADLAHVDIDEYARRTASYATAPTWHRCAPASPSTRRAHSSDDRRAVVADVPLGPGGRTGGARLGARRHRHRARGPHRTER